MQIITNQWGHLDQTDIITTMSTNPNNNNLSISSKLSSSTTTLKVESHRTSFHL